jgi:hypothetical protein
MLTLPEVRLAVIGLGYVGLPLAVEFGKHRDVLGFDINAARIDALRAGHDATLEVDDAELRDARGLRYTADAAALSACNVFIVTVPTPIDEHKRPDLTPLIKASETVGRVLKRGDIVIYESTVYPGATEEDCVPVLERCSGLRFNVDFFAGYSPERINPGDTGDLCTVSAVALTSVVSPLLGSHPLLFDQCGHSRKPHKQPPRGGRSNQAVHGAEHTSPPNQRNQKPAVTSAQPSCYVPGKKNRKAKCSYHTVTEQRTHVSAVRATILIQKQFSRLTAAQPNTTVCRPDP